MNKKVLKIAHGNGREITLLAIVNAWYDEEAVLSSTRAWLALMSNCLCDAWLTIPLTHYVSYTKPGFHLGAFCFPLRLFFHQLPQRA